jgi:hypothetical protein
MIFSHNIDLFKTEFSPKPEQPNTKSSLLPTPTSFLPPDTDRFILERQEIDSEREFLCKNRVPFTPHYHP